MGYGQIGKEVIIKQNFTKIFAILVLSFSLIGCSTDGNYHGHIVIKLDDERLENTPSGFWLKVFDIDYTASTRLKRQVINKIKTGGTLLNDGVRQERANKIRSYTYQYRDYKIYLEYYSGGLWEGPEVVPFQEYYNGGWNGWVSIDLGQGIPYSRLLPNRYKELNENKKYRHRATIESAIDQGRRLFLFGWDKCNRISLF